MTMEIDALHAGLPMRNSLDPCETCAEYQALAARLAQALAQMLTHMGMDEDEWNAKTFKDARAALAAWESAK